MDEIKQITNLIRLVNANTALTELVKSGLRYSQISQLLEKAIEKKYITPENGSFLVTPKGLALIHKKPSKAYPDGGWIIPLDDKKIEKIGILTPYLPSKATASKLIRATSASGLLHRGDESSS